MSRKAFSPLILWVTVLIFAQVACGAAATGETGAEPPAATEAPAILETAIPTSPSVIAPTVQVQPVIPERRRLTLDYPPRIRAGDSDILRLTLEVDKDGNLTPTAVVEGNVVTGEIIEIPNLFETHHVIVEARFDIAGIEVSPPGVSNQTLSPGQNVQFFWSIRPQDVGLYRGTIWLFLRFVDKISQEESQRAISAQSVEIEAVNFFGIPARVVRVAGGVGSVVGGIIGFPFFEDIIRFVLGRRKKR